MGVNSDTPAPTERAAAPEGDHVPRDLEEALDLGAACCLAGVRPCVQGPARFAGPVSRLGVLVWNATHDGEHYGNLVVYMRANNIVPPSSQGGS